MGTAKVKAEITAEVTVEKKRRIGTTEHLNARLP